LNVFFKKLANCFIRPGFGGGGGARVGGASGIGACVGGGGATTLGVIGLLG
jgi:hypothetical protein